MLKALTDVSDVCHLPRGIQRQDSVPGAVGPAEEDAPRGAEEDLRDVLLG